MRRLVRITAPHFVAGVEVGERAAPIVGHMAHWNLGRIRDYCNSMGWRCEDARPAPNSVKYR